MISKQMYEIISKIPLPTESMHYDKLLPLCNLDENTFRHYLVQANGKFICAPTTPIEKSNIVLLDLGIAEIEEYEAREENNRMAKDTLLISKNSLTVAIIALAVSIISVLPTIFEFLSTVVQ